MNEVPNEGIIRVPSFFNSDWLLLTDPKALADVLVHKCYDFEKVAGVRQILRAVLGDGLVVVEGDEHKFQRKHVSPAFSFRHIRDLYPIFWSKAIELIDCVAAELQHDSVVEVNHWANKVTMDIIGLAGLGRNFNTLHNSDDQLIKTYEEILEPTTEKAMFFAAHMFLTRWVIAKLPWKLNQKLKDMTSALKSMSQQLVREKKELIKVQGDEHVDIMSVLIKSNNFADDMIAEQLLTFLAAGYILSPFPPSPQSLPILTLILRHETTSSAFTWGTYLLSLHPAAQSRLRAEVRAAIPSPSAPPPDLATTLDSLPYLHATVSEILRLYPTVPVTVRVSIRPTTILNTPIPAQTPLYISPWAINRSPAFWGPTAHLFLPDRFLDPVTQKPTSGGVDSNYASMTFLHGPRSCIGEKFARAELKCLIALWVARFEFEMADKTEVPLPAGAVTSKPGNGMRLRIRPVEGW
jgi:cytochrome P450